MTPVKKATAKKATKKKTAAKKATTRKAVAGRAPSTAIADAYATRAAAKAAKRGRAGQRLAFHEEMHGDVDIVALNSALHGAHAGPAPMAFPATNTNRWVPIGPTVTRRGQAMSRPRISGRIRDLAVSSDGQRAYVASAKGGVWYSGDGGSTWAPVGGWAGRSVNPQGNGNMFSTGSLLVDFSGGMAATDVVMVGTGEAIPALTETGSSAQGGIGVLAALGPATDPVDADPWEPDTGGALLAGLGVWRLVRHPAATALSDSGPTQDRVLAATTNGLYLGTRSALPPVGCRPSSRAGRAGATGPPRPFRLHVGRVRRRRARSCTGPNRRHRRGLAPERRADSASSTPFAGSASSSATTMERPPRRSPRCKHRA